jgi:hypothetical protein
VARRVRGSSVREPPFDILISFRSKGRQAPQIVAGAILLRRVEAGEFDSRTFKRWTDKALTRKDDSELFGLAPRSPEGGN